MEVPVAKDGCEYGHKIDYESDLDERQVLDGMVEKEQSEAALESTVCERDTHAWLHGGEEDLFEVDVDDH